MKVKVTGSQWKQFIADENVWGKDEKYYEETSFYLNDVSQDNNDSFIVDDIGDADILTVEGGIMLSNVDYQWSGPTVAGVLRNWLKAQSTCAFIVEVDKSKRDELVELIKQNGGKVINKAIS